MIDWKISLQLARLGHLVKVNEYGWRCGRCGRTFADIIKLGIRCTT